MIIIKKAIVKMALQVSILILSHDLAMKPTQGTEEEVICSVSEAENSAWAVEIKSGCSLSNLY